MTIGISDLEQLHLTDGSPIGDNPTTAFSRKLPRTSSADSKKRPSRSYRGVDLHNEHHSRQLSFPYRPLRHTRRCFDGETSIV